VQSGCQVTMRAMDPARLCIYFSYARRHTAERFGALGTGSGAGAGDAA
jgi:hypothetical protein